MAVFSRLGDILNADIDAMIAASREPARTARLVVQEVEDTLVEVRIQAARGIAELKDHERRTTALAAAVADWAQKAEFALTKDREDLARGALAAKKRASEEFDEAESLRAACAARVAKAQRDLKSLEAKLEDARSAAKRVERDKPGRLGREDMDRPFGARNATAQAVEQEFGAPTPAARAPRGLNEALEDLKSGDDVERELEELRRRLSKDREA